MRCSHCTYCAYLLHLGHAATPKQAVSAVDCWWWWGETMSFVQATTGKSNVHLQLHWLLSRWGWLTYSHNISPTTNYPDNSYYNFAFSAFHQQLFYRGFLWFCGSSFTEISLGICVYIYLYTFSSIIVIYSSNLQYYTILRP